MGPQPGRCAAAGALLLALLLALAPAARAIENGSCIVGALARAAGPGPTGHPRPAPASVRPVSRRTSLPPPIYTHTRTHAHAPPEIPVTGSLGLQGTVTYTVTYEDYGEDYGEGGEDHVHIHKITTKVIGVGGREPRAMAAAIRHS